jgi:hypothetical protein
MIGLLAIAAASWACALASATAAAHLQLAEVVCAECSVCPRAERVEIARVALRRLRQPRWAPLGLSGLLTAPRQWATPPADCRAHWGLFLPAWRERYLGAVAAALRDCPPGPTLFHSWDIIMEWPNEWRAPARTWHHRFFLETP